MVAPSGVGGAHHSAWRYAFFPRCRTQPCNSLEKDATAGRYNAQVSGFMESSSMGDGST